MPIRGFDLYIFILFFFQSINIFTIAAAIFYAIAERSNFIFTHFRFFRIDVFFFLNYLFCIYWGE